MTKEESIKDYLEETINYAVKQKVDVIIGKGIENVENQIRFSQKKIDINKQWQSARIEFMLVVNNNYMVTGEFSPTSKEMVKLEIDQAIEFANKVDPSFLFQGVEDKIQPFPTIENAYDKKIDEFTVESPELVNTAIDAAIDSGAKRVAGSLLFGKRLETLMSSAGPKGDFASTYYNLTIRAFQETLDSSGQGLICGRSFKNVEAEFKNAGKRAGKFSKLHLDCKQGKPGTYDLILTPAVAGNLLGGLVEMANPIQVMVGMSPFQDKLGEEIAPENITVSDDALMPGGLGSEPYDFEGTPHRTTPIIKDGALVNFIHNTSTASIFDVETTGNSALADLGVGSKLLAPVASNLVFNNGNYSFEELLEGSKPIIYVTCNWYTRFTSYVSTEFSSIPRDAMFLVEKNELSQPIKNVRISDNLLRMLKNISAMGNDRVQVQWWEVSTPTFIPTIKISDCKITAATI
ncbi:MAG: TldD/PmbA family protein [Candidatus Hermodarchaeota archaeon]